MARVSFEEPPPPQASSRRGALPFRRRVVFAAVPACGAISMFLFAKTAVQLFWLDRGLPTAQLGSWFFVQSVAQLVAIAAAPRRGLTLCIAGVVCAVLVGGTLVINRSPRAVWCFALAGVYEPLAAALLRLRDERLDAAGFDRSSELLFSSLMLGLLVSSSGGTLLESVGAVPLCAIDAGAAAVVVAAHVVFLCSASGPEATPTGRRQRVGDDDDDDVVHDEENAFVASYGAADYYGETTIAVKPAQTHNSGAKSTAGSEEQQTPLGEQHARSSSSSHHTPERLLQGRRMLTLMAGIMFGVGVTDALVTTVAPMWFQRELGASPWPLFLALLVSFAASTVQASFWTAVGVSFTPQSLNVALLVASGLWTAMAVFEPNLWLTGAVIVAYSLCMNFPHCTSMRVIDSYAYSKAIFEKFAVSQRVCYCLGCLVGGVAGPNVYFWCSRRDNPRLVFLVLSYALALMAAVSGSLFLANVVHIGTEQLRQILDLEDAYDYAVASQRRGGSAHHPRGGGPASSGTRDKGGGRVASTGRHAGDGEHDDAATSPPPSPITPRRAFLLSDQSERQSLMNLVRDLKDHKLRRVPSRAEMLLEDGGGGGAVEMRGDARSGSRSAHRASTAAPRKTKPPAFSS